MLQKLCLRHSQNALDTIKLTQLAFKAIHLCLLILLELQDLNVALKCRLNLVNDPHGLNLNELFH